MCRTPDSIITGNLQDIFKAEAAAKHQIWTGKVTLVWRASIYTIRRLYEPILYRPSSKNKSAGRYGPTIMYRGFLGGNRLYTTDPKVLLHILIQKAVSSVVVVVTVSDTCKVSVLAN